MPEYSFICDRNQMGCGHEFSIVCSISDYTSEVECKSCGQSDNIIRNYAEDTNHGFIRKSSTDIKVGHLAKRNSEKMSNDEKDSLWWKHNKYKYKKSEKKLPKGMKVIDKIVPTRKQATSKKKGK